MNNNTFNSDFYYLPNNYSSQMILNENQIKKLTLRNNYTKLLSKEQVNQLSKLNLDNSPLNIYPYYNKPGNIEIIGDIPKFIDHNKTKFMNQRLEVINKFNQFYNDKFQPLENEN